MRDPHPSDLVAQATFLGADDKVYRRERKRRNAPKVALPSLPDGPCCARCGQWQAPADPDDHGECRATVVQVDGFADERRVYTRAEAMALLRMGVEPLATRGFFAGCSLFEVRGEEEAA